MHALSFNPPLLGTLITPSQMALAVSMILLIGGSFVFWARTLVRGVAQSPPFHPRSSPLPANRRLYLFLAGAFLAVAQSLIVPPLIQARLATESATESVEQTTPADVDATSPAATKPLSRALQLQVIRIGCGAEMMIFCVGLIVVLGMSVDDRRAAGFQGVELGVQTRSGLIGFVAAMAPVYLVVLATLPLRSPDTQHSLLRALSSTPDAELMAWIALQAIVLAPLAEEMLYRVLLQGGLVQAGYPAVFAVPAVALFFSLSHNFPDTLPLVPLALVLGWVYHLRNSFLACVLIHALFNAFNVAMVVAGAPVR